MADMTNTTGGVFIPEVWADSVRAFLRAKLVMGNLVRLFRHEGQPGDIIHEPDLSELAANDFNETGEVVIQSITEGEFTLTIDKHSESSFLVKNLFKIQEKYDVMSRYTSAAAYALAKKYDIDLYNALLGPTGIALARYNANGGALSDGGAAITRDGLLTALQKLDDNNVPEEGRFVILPPVAKKTILGIDNFISGDYISGKPVVTGEMGSFFGARVLMTTQIPTKTNGLTALKQQILVGQTDMGASAIQKRISSDSQKMLKKLGHLVVTDMIYGNALHRAESGVILRLNT